MARFLFYDDKIINILLKEEEASGGAAVQAYGWIRGLMEFGQEVVVMTNMNKKGPLKDECRDIKFIPFYNFSKGLRWLRWIYYRIPYMYRNIKKAKPDYVYQGVPGWTSFFLALICYRLNIKYILRISNDYLIDERILRSYSRAHRFFQMWGMRLAHCILCQNEYQYKIIRKKFPDKMVIKITNPVFMKNDSKGFGVDARSYIAWIGIFQYQKNIKLLYNIATMLKDERFLIAGTEIRNCDEQTLSYLEKLKKLPNVQFVGFLNRNQVIPFLSSAKFLLNTSHYEGFSNTFLEAMLAGTPIMTSNMVNPDFIISRNNLGIVYHDEVELLSKYHSVNSEQYKRMSDNVKEYVAHQHDYKVLSKRLIEMLAVEKA